MSEKLEFASAEWVDAMRRIVEEQLRETDLSGIAFSFSEEFTDPPEHLREPGAKSIGWYLRIAEGKVEVGRGVLESADSRVIADYQTTLPLARMVFGDNPQLAKEAAALVAEATAAGRMRREGDPAAGARVPLAGLHDEIARLTA